jgi:hypothetical protein
LQRAGEWHSPNRQAGQEWANARIKELLKLFGRFDRVPWADGNAVQLARNPRLGGSIFVYANHDYTTLRVGKRRHGRRQLVPDESVFILSLRKGLARLELKSAGLGLAEQGQQVMFSPLARVPRKHCGSHSTTRKGPKQRCSFDVAAERKDIAERKDTADRLRFGLWLPNIRLARAVRGRT